MPGGMSIGMRLNSRSVGMGKRSGTHLKCLELLFRKRCVLSYGSIDEYLTHVGCCINRGNHYRGPSLVCKLCTTLDLKSASQRPHHVLS